IQNLAAPMTRGTLRGARPRLAARALAPFAPLHPRHLDLRAHPEHRVFERDLQVIAHILAALRPRPAAATPAALSEQIAEPEEIAQNVAEIRERFPVEL